MLVNNLYYDAIVEKISKLSKEECTGQNRLIDIGKLSSAADLVLCKGCISEEIENERDKTVDILASH